MEKRVEGELVELIINTTCPGTLTALSGTILKFNTEAQGYSS